MKSRMYLVFHNARPNA